MNVRRTAGRVGPGLVVLVVMACAPAPTVTPDPAALPVSFALVWDIPGSTLDDGRCCYFDGPNPRLLRPGPVLVSWWCSGSGSLTIVPGHVAGPPALPPANSPLAFQVTCPTGGSSYSGWRRLAFPAIGGENAVDIHPAAASGAAISYRIFFAQQAP